MYTPSHVYLNRNVGIMRVGRLHGCVRRGTGAVPKCAECMEQRHRPVSPPVVLGTCRSGISEFRAAFPSINPGARETVLYYTTRVCRPNTETVLPSYARRILATIIFTRTMSHVLRAPCNRLHLNVIYT